MSRNIKQENWAELARTVREMMAPINTTFATKAAMAFYRGEPGNYVSSVSVYLNRIIQDTYSASQRAKAKSLLETFKNYGIAA